jgi:hypothetical protein
MRPRSVARFFLFDHWPERGGRDPPVAQGDAVHRALSIPGRRDHPATTSLVGIDDAAGWVFVLTTGCHRNERGSRIGRLSRWAENAFINGMGEVIRGLNVDTLWLHRIGAHGGGALPATKAVEDLISLANDEGTEVYEVFAGEQAFGGALTILGPDKDYYDELVEAQVSGLSLAESARKAIAAAGRSVWDRVAGVLGDEVPFPEKEVTPRNNSSMITLLSLDDNRILLTADAGCACVGHRRLCSPSAIAR